MADKNTVLHPQGDSSTNLYPQTKVENIIDLDLDDYATKEDLEDKQDTISDLETIRTGAGLGATALQSVPNTYRTSADQDVIDAGKQATLVSGTNIKTINSQSILGSGDLEIGGSEYDAGNGLTLSGTTFSVDEDVVALKEDLPEGEVDLTLTSTSISDGTTTLDVASLIQAAIGDAMEDSY